MVLPTNKEMMDMGMIPDQYENMATFASLRQPAWHGLGTVFENEVSTEEMLNLSSLAKWNVRLEEFKWHVPLLEPICQVDTTQSSSEDPDSTVLFSCF